MPKMSLHETQAYERLYLRPVRALVLTSILVIPGMRLGLIAFLLGLFLPALHAKPVKVILDSELGNDCEDAGAMAVLHVLADRGEAETLAAIYPMRDRWGASAMNAINTYYGRSDIPVGTYRGDSGECGRPQIYAVANYEFPQMK